MNKKYLYVGIFVGILIVILSAYWIVKSGGDNSVFGRATQGEFTIFTGAQGLTSMSYDGGDDTIIVDGTNRGRVAVGDAVMFNTASIAFDDTALVGGTKYYVITASISDRFEVSLTKGGTVVDIATAASAGGGEFFTTEIPERDFNVENYEFITISINAEEAPSVSFKFLGSTADTAPDWYASKSVSNRYEHLDVYDAQDGSSIDGDTGIAQIAGTDTNRLFQVSFINNLKWFTVISENYASGSVDVRVKGAE